MPREIGRIFLDQNIRLIQRGLKTQTRRPYKESRPNEWRVGDVVWIKEAWAINDPPSGYNYRADWPWEKEGWNNPLFMPRKVARIFLDVIAVRVQKLHEITEEDAIAEGVGEVHSQDGIERSAVEEYQRLWNQLHGDGAWDVNPKVWAISFRRRPS